VPDDPHSPDADQPAASLTRRAHDVLAAAERAAAQIRLSAEQDAERVLARAHRDADAYLEEAVLRVDAFAAGRTRRIGELADRLLAHAEALAARAARAERLRSGIDAVVEALAAAAEAVAAEARRPPIVLPRPSETGAEVTRLTTRPHAVPDPGPEPSPADDAGAHVREIARALPRRPGPPRVRPQPPPPDPPDGPDAPDAA
jgi:hypothetical protein